MGRWGPSTSAHAHVNEVVVWGSEEGPHTAAGTRPIAAGTGRSRPESFTACFSARRPPILPRSGGTVVQAAHSRTLRSPVPLAPSRPAQPCTAAVVCTVLPLAPPCPVSDLWDRPKHNGLISAPAPSGFSPRLPRLP